MAVPPSYRATQHELLQEVNDAIAYLGWTLNESDTIDFLCECGDVTCIERVSLTIAQYADARERGFLLRDGHCTE